jgi:hypothetical protein
MVNEPRTCCGLTVERGKDPTCRWIFKFHFAPSASLVGQSSLWYRCNNLNLTMPDDPLRVRRRCLVCIQFFTHCTVMFSLFLPTEGIVVPRAHQRLAVLNYTANLARHLPHVCRKFSVCPIYDAKHVSTEQGAPIWLVVGQSSVIVYCDDIKCLRFV